MMQLVVWMLGGSVSQLPFLQGAWGEQQTEEELNRLGAGWLVEHDVARERGNWDHVAVSQAGVFMIETKWTSRSAAVEGDELRFGPVAYPGAAFRGAAVGLRDALATLTGQPPWVTAVVAVWGTFEQGAVDGDRVTILRGELLADWLRAQPKRLSDSRTRQLVS